MIEVGSLAESILLLMVAWRGRCLGDKVTGRGRRRGTSSAGPEAVGWVLRIDVLG